MRRREFITLLGGAAAAWPLTARAQQSKIIRLGYLEPQRPTEAVAANLRRQFLLGLRDLGYVEGVISRLRIAAPTANSNASAI